MLLDRRKFLVKEQVALLKLTDRYDIFDPTTGERVGFAQEQIGTFLQLLRLVASKQFLPTTIVVKEDEFSDPVVTITRRFNWFRAKVDVIDQNHSQVGFFLSKMFSFAGGFTVHNPDGQQIADVKGNWKGWDFQLLDMNGTELGRVNKQWAGALTELFTSADNYVITLNESVGHHAGLSALLLAAGLAIDIVFKEGE